MKKTKKYLSLLLAGMLSISTAVLPVNIFAEEISSTEINIEEPAETAVSAENSDNTQSSSDVIQETIEEDFLPGRVVVTMKQNPASAYGIAPFSNNEDSILSNPIFDGIDIANAEVISSANNSSSSAENNIMTLGDTTEDEAGDILLLELSDQSKQAVLDAVNQLQADEAVLYAEPDYLYEYCETIPNDESYYDQWGLHRLHASKAWDTFTGNPEIVVGVIDSGIDYTHPDLADNIWVNTGEIPGNGIDDDQDGYIDDTIGWHFYKNTNDPMDNEYHGTHVSGIIAAKGNNEIGISGVAWNTKIAPLNAGAGNSEVDTISVIKALAYATFHGFDIVNASFGGTAYGGGMKTAIERYPGLFVAGAGNEGTDIDVHPFYPAAYDCDNILSVANMNVNGNLNYDACYGAVSVDSAAPGTDILSTFPGNDYSPLSGASMATPFVSGAAALLKGYNTSLSTAELKEQILSSVQSFNDPDKVSSGGCLDLANLFTSSNGTANDCILDAGKDEWWTTSIEWNQYSGIDENEPYMQQCRFNIDSIDVRCKNETYTVPSKTFKYDVIEANYDYEPNHEYELCVKVTYDGTAEYFIDPGHRQLEMGQDNKKTAYFDDYALFWVADVYSDSNGQLFSHSAKPVVPNYTWWNHSLTYDPENKPNSTLNIDGMQVYADGNYYTVPAKTINMRPAAKTPTIAQERYNALAVRISKDGTAEYGTYLPWYDRDNPKPIFDQYGITIPIFDFMYGPNYELLVTKLWFNNNIYYQNDGVVYPGKDIWWNTGINWEQYAPDEGPYFQKCLFKADSINVVCKNQTYTVPSRNFRYDVIEAIYDYEPEREYYLTVKVNYNGAAQYQLENNVNEYNSNSAAVVYYDDYAVMPIGRVYSDKNGQLFFKSILNFSVYTNGQCITQMSAPVLNTNLKFKDIAAERETAVGLTADGEVYVWGDGAYYDLGQGQVKLNQYTPVKVEGLPEIVKIAKGKHHVLALDVNGEVWGWGNNSSGEVHGAYKGKVYVPSKISGLSNITDITAGTGFSAAIKSDGTLWTWGNNTDGKLGDRGTSAANVPAPVTGLSNVSKVTCGEKFMAALSGETVYTWGNNESGQLGSGTNDSTSTPTAITGSYKDIAAGNSHMLAVSTSDELFTWGYNSVGQLGLGDKISRNVPTSTGKTAAVIGAGYNHSFYTDGESIYGFGSNSKGQLGIGIQNTALTPTLIAGLRNIVKIDGGFDFTIAKDKDNNIWVFGNNNVGQLGIY